MIFRPNNFVERAAKKTLLATVLLLFTLISFSQPADSTKAISHFSGSVSVTNNGISLIPSFSLGDPALIFDISMGKGRLSFDPQLRFALEGKPWSFIFWWRYKLVNREKFQFRIGAHPSLVFTDEIYVLESETVETTGTRRYLVAELAPSIPVTGKFTLKPYYLVSRGFDAGLKQAHYLALQSSISPIRIANNLDFGLTPQIYYLKTDNLDGFYYASGFSLSHDKIPISLGAMFNKKIKTEIASKDFIWNISLIYSFEKLYHEI